MPKRQRETLIPLVLLASASGARTWSGLAALSRRMPAKLCAAGELIYDKVPGVPSRVAPSLLAGRIAAGAIVGFVVGRRTGRHRLASAIGGGLIAGASAHLTYRMRRELSDRLPAIAAALVEDGIVVGAAVAGASILRE